MGRKSILVVDDSFFMRQRIREALSDNDFDLFSARDGREAMYWVEDNPPVDLVITDLHMPNMDGLDLIGQLRAHDDYRKAPIFVLTSGAEPEEKERVRAAGATAWIVKPFDTAKLKTAIRSVVH